MRLFDNEINTIADTDTTIEIFGKNYYVKSNRRGTCDGCSFDYVRKCPSKARSICTSNGGNVLVEKEINK